MWGEVASKRRTGGGEGERDGLIKIGPPVQKSQRQLWISQLIDIINCSFGTGINSNDIKIAKVIPVYKSGLEDVFLTTALYFFYHSSQRFLKKLAYSRLFNYIEKYAILNPNQHGFSKNHSTDIALIDITDKISQAINNRLYSAGIS